MDALVRNAIARIDVNDGGKNLSRGTGCLVADRLVLTALHVVANRFENPPAAYPGTITLTFPECKVEATLYETYYDPQGDWAILKCEESVPIQPLPLADLRESGGEFVTYGFPDSQPVDGMIQTGTVENHHGQLNGIHAIQLYSKQAAAGDGAPVKGLSGAPMLMDNAVVGVLRFALQSSTEL